MRDVKDAHVIPYYIPPMPKPGSHHVISRGQRPDFYQPEQLQDTGIAKTGWVDAFEKLVVGLYWTLDAPVPYAFRTPDAVIRSLDAGCIKFLCNRKPAELCLILDDQGYIDAVVPTKPLLDRYSRLRSRLMTRIRTAGPDEDLRGHLHLL